MLFVGNSRVVSVFSRGTVKFYDPRKEFGFIKGVNLRPFPNLRGSYKPGGVDLHFSGDSVFRIIPGDEEPYFGGQGYSRPLEPGEDVIVVPTRSTKGLTAAYVARESDFVAARMVIDKRPIYYLFAIQVGQPTDLWSGGPHELHDPGYLGVSDIEHKYGSKWWARCLPGEKIKTCGEVPWLFSAQFRDDGSRIIPKRDEYEIGYLLGDTPSRWWKQNPYIREESPGLFVVYTNGGSIAPTRPIYRDYSAEACTQWMSKVLRNRHFNMDKVAVIIFE